MTHLNDSGAGSFRDAVSAAGRFVVFDVGGYVSLKTAVSVNSDITIASQTAPGQGIALKGGEISFASHSNIIMRHVRVRPGSDTASDTDDALSLFEAKTVMVDPIDALSTVSSSDSSASELRAKLHYPPLLTPESNGVHVGIVAARRPCARLKACGKFRENG